MKKHIRKIMLASTVVLGVAATASCAQKKTYITYNEPQNLVTFGKSAQTLVEDETLVNTLNETTFDEETSMAVVDGKTYYKSEEATPATEIYTSESGKTTFVTGEVYYFEVEPVKWRILAEDDTTYTLLSEKIHLSGSIYAGDVVANKIAEADKAKAYSKGVNKVTQCKKAKTWFETFMNDELEQNLLNLSFSEEYIKQPDAEEATGTLETRNVSIQYAPLSYEDVLNTNYGFASTTDADATRIALTTDFARANGAWMAVSDGIRGYGKYATRTLTFTDTWYTGQVYFVDEQGQVKTDYAVDTHLGVRPMIKVAKTAITA